MTSTTDDAQLRPAEAQSSIDRRQMGAVDAFIDLVLERGDTPTAEEVAERAGVSRATFFRYFSTLGDLRSHATVRIGERFTELLDIPDAGALDERIRHFVHARFRLHETLHALELVSRQHAVGDDEAAGLIDAVRLVFADQARRHFADDLDRLSPAQLDDIVTAITVLTSVESWQQFRHTHGRTPLQTRRAWRRALASLLAAPDGDSTHDPESIT